MIRIREFAWISVSFVCLSSLSGFAADPLPTPPRRTGGIIEVSDSPTAPLEQQQATLELLDSPDVHQDLSVSPDQRQKIQALVQSIRNDIQNFQANPQQFGEGEAGSQEMKAKMGLLFEKYRTQVAGILTPEQTQRLKQLSFQIRGMRSVVDADVSQALKLSDEQLTKIQTLIANAQTARRNARRAPRAPGRFGLQERRA